MANQIDPEVPRKNLEPLRPDFAINKGRRTGHQQAINRRRVQVIWSKLEVAIRNLLGAVIGYENLRYEADRVKARIFRTEVTDSLK
jgi:hypothetical protein